MPQAFSDEQKEILRARLLDAAYRLFTLQGFRVTTVDQLARSAHIGKGTFYLFFASKEELLWALHARLHDDFDHKVSVILSDLATKPQETLRRFIRAVFDLLADPLAVSLQQSGDLQLILRMRTPAQVAEDRDATLRPLIQAIGDAQRSGVITPGDPRIIAGVIRSVCLVALHPDDIGRDQFPQVVDLLIDLVATGLARQVETNGGAKRT